MAKIFFILIYNNIVRGYVGIKWLTRDRRRITEGLSGYGLKIRRLMLFIGDCCNALIFRWCVVVVKKVLKNVLMWECVNVGMC